VGTGDVAVVTGAANGIGRALADHFGAAGLGVALADVELAPAEEAAEESRCAGIDAIGVGTDVSDPAAVADIARLDLPR
jgi:NAD(P)-dependent dehydrogenase (short-subunit alcohol dehydrogenase family)